MKKIYRFVFNLMLFNLTFFCSINSFSQAPEIEWQKTIGGSANDYMYFIQQTSDGGYILGGESYSGISGDKTEALQGGSDYWVVKLNASGNIEWQNTIGGSDYDVLHSIKQTADGGYILGGVSSSGISGDKTGASQGQFDCWVVKLDVSGDILWQNTIGGNSYDYLHSVQQTVDGEYILGCFSSSGISGNKTVASLGGLDYWMVKLDTAGAIKWQNAVGGNNDDYLSCIQQTTDEGYILGGYSISGISGDKTEASQGSDYWIVKVDTAGNVQWQNTIGGSDYDYLWSLSQCTDGGFIIGGHSFSGISGDKTETAWTDINGFNTSDFWIVKVDDAGNLEWENTIGGTSADVSYSVQQTTDGIYILGGYSSSGISGDKTESNQGVADYWVILLDGSGDMEWQKTWGGTYDDKVAFMQQTNDEGYILGGYSASGISGDKTEESNGGVDYWVVKLEGVPTTGLPETESVKSQFAVYPNPANNTATINAQIGTPGNIKVQIYDINGKLISSEDVVTQSINFNHTLSLEGMANGIYLVEIKVNGEKQMQKLSVMKN